ncbi:MAG TPA: hypothetical protein VER55_13685 [Ardenticatenaceae bacterium]|nr:hypothetical protein [Ardenticatenaceae bacterium]
MRSRPSSYSRHVAWLALSVAGLLLAGCVGQNLLPTPMPSATLVRITATLAPTFTLTPPPATSTPLPTETPLPTYTALPTYTPLPSATPTPRIPPSPASFLDFPDTIRRIADTVGGNPEELWLALAGWGAIREGQGAVRQADITRDGTADLVVWYINPVAENLPLPQGDVLVLTPEGPNWRIVFDANFGSAAGTVGLGVQLLAADDLNGDGESEMAWTWAECGAHTCFTTVEIGAWTGSGFSDLTASEIQFPTLDRAEVVDQNGDGAKDVVLTGGTINSAGAGPQRTRTEVYAWNGSGWALSQTLYAATDWLALVVWEANDRLAADDLPGAMDLYTLAVTSPSLRSWHGENNTGRMSAEEERALLTAFSHWRLVLANTVLGREDEAEEWLSQLEDSQPASPYRTVAERFWETWERTSDLDDACEAANSYAAANRPLVVEPLNTFGYSNPQFEADDICIVP